MRNYRHHLTHCTEDLYLASIFITHSLNDIKRYIPDECDLGHIENQLDQLVGPRY